MMLRKASAGCTAARLFALRGARVALVEKRPDPDAYKTVCTHFVQASATPTIEKLGLAPLLETRGAVHNRADLWTLGSGWIVAGCSASCVVSSRATKLSFRAS